MIDDKNETNRNIEKALKKGETACGKLKEKQNEKGAIELETTV